MGEPNPLAAGCAVLLMLVALAAIPAGIVLVPIAIYKAAIWLLAL